MSPSTQFEVPIGWGVISGQIFGNPGNPNSKPIFAMHGFLDNSNSFKPIAPHITKDEKYHIIAIDLPGMGFSSKLPDGIPYSIKLYLMGIRRVVKHFNLKNFLFMTHSFGCSLALAYSACYHDEVLGLMLIDFAMHDCNVVEKDKLSECWKEGIETYLKAEKLLEEKAKSKKTETELTYEHALSRLLASNKHIDENAAKILLERGLTTVNGKYEYTRDLRLVAGISMRDYHAEYFGIYDCLFSKIECPIVLIYATPPAYGQKIFDQIMHIMNGIKQSDKSDVILIPIEGTHHFHMLKPQETSEILLKFIDEKYKILDQNNNNFQIEDKTN